MVSVKESAEHFPPEEEDKSEEAESGEVGEEAAADEEGSEGSKAAKSEEEEGKEGVKGGETRDLKKKRGKRRMEPSSPVTPGGAASSLRPTRERKSVDRYYAVSPPSSSAAKPLSIQKGRGMQLKDIPNVAYKLSKRKPDENLQTLHIILYGKKAKARNLKKNIGQFSGYAWAEDELEKQRGRLRDKFDKCVKEKLLDFCDLLNVPAYKSSTKKEELTLKLFEFLESPHITTDKLLVDKEKKRKNQRGKVTKTKRSIDTTADSPAKKPEGKAGRKRKQSSEREDAESSPPRSESEEEDDDANDKKDQKGTISEDDDMELEGAEESSKEDHNSPTKDYGTSTEDKDISVKPSKTSDKSTKESSSSTLKRGDDSSTNPEVEISKRQKTATDSGGEDKNASAAEKASLKRKLSGKEKNAKVEKPEPSKEEIYAAAVNILKGANFDTATLNDIIRQLGCQFGVDFKPRKAEVKAIITEAINDMSGDEEEEDGDDESAELKS